jgi:hypothetical protein
LIRLDRVLVSVDGDELFPNSLLRSLGSDVSDHCPLLLSTNLKSAFKARFHFEIFWPRFDDYEQAVLSAWLRPQSVLPPMYRLDRML